jgi:hypothetical protein
MRVVLNGSGSEVRTVRMEALPEEVRTIYAALQEYKQNLLKTVAESHEANHSVGRAGIAIEDEQFCYGEVAKVAKLQYELVENHSSIEARQWMERFLL